MFRHTPARRSRTVSDTELGVAAVLLFFVVLLTVIVVPALG